jgi:A/G-specific adenine glycosylase
MLTNKPILMKFEKEMKRSVLHQFFVDQLLLWNLQDNTRQMPWKGEKDPYKIWLSEIILQQTRVEQGLGYYNRFIQTFPTILQLANASETKIFKLWEGLGYYSRCKNLIATAKYISTELNGKFPDKYDDILQLKGIGPYTAAAIASFAFNLPHAVLDGNVFRVLARYFGIDTAVDSAEGKQIFTTLSNELLDLNQPGNYNQALMDFGAVICKPQIPLCGTCIFKSKCRGFKKNLVHQLPVKEKKIIKKGRWFYYLVIEYNGKQYVRKRGAKDIWENLHEFVLIESGNPLSLEQLKQQEKVKKLFGKNNFEIMYLSSVYKQVLTHQTIQGQFIQIKTFKPLPGTEYEAFTPEQIETLPFPKFITSYLKDKNVSLNLF